MTIRQAIESAKNMQRALTDLLSRGLDPDDADLVLTLNHGCMDDLPTVQLHNPPLAEDEIERDNANNCNRHILHTVHGARILWISFEDAEEASE